MTRKQALTLAIQALSGIEQGKTAIPILETMRDELPLNRWSDAAIRDSIEQFVLDHGRIPNVSDFKYRGLPPHPVIKNKYGVNLQEWLFKSYPELPELLEEAQAAATERFIQEYLRIQPKSAAKFNKERSPDCSCWYTVARYNQTTTWRVLLEKLELPIFSKVKVPKKKRGYYVRFETCLDDMKPLRKQVLKEMIEENHPAFPAPNFKVVLRKDEKDPSVEHFILQYVTDKRLEYEARKCAEQQTV